MHVGRRMVALVAVAALAVAACGDDDEATTDLDPGTEETDTGADEKATDEDTEADDTVDDEALAAMASFQRDDFPETWTEAPADPSDDEDDDAQHAAMAECLGEDVETLYPDDEVEVTSPTFTSPDDQDVESSVSVDDSADEAEFRFATLTSPEAISCIGQTLEAKLAEDGGFGAGVEVEGFSIDPLEFTSVGDDSAAYRTTISITAEGSSIDVYLDIVLARIGRVLFSGQVTSVGSPFPTADFEGIVTTAVDRIDEDAAA